MSVHFLGIYLPAALSLEQTSAIVFYFTVYSLFGWLLENSYSFVTKREFFKANFFLGPFKPMYGFAPVLLVYLIGPETSLTMMIFLCFFIPTFIEYISGVMLQKFIRKQFWDYTDMPLQLQGHICLPFSLCWIFLSIACIKWIHPGIQSLYGGIEPFWAWIWPAVMLYFIAELAIAVRRHSLASFSPTIQ